MPARVLALSSLVLALAACRDEAGPPTSDRSGRSAAAAAPRVQPLASPWRHLPRGWGMLPRPPVWRSAAVQVWSGRELVFWGGDTQGDAVHHADGVAYDPVRDRWRRVPPAPVPGRSQAGAAWTGSELVIWGGTAGGPLGDGAAYSPANDSWRVLPGAPLDPRIPAAVVWSGEEMIVWGDAGRGAASVAGAALDPATNRWRELPPAPYPLNEADAAWTGREMIVVGATLDGFNGSLTPSAQAQAYEPRADRWRALPPAPLSPQASTVVWTGKELLAADYELRAAELDPESGRWQTLPDLPLDRMECPPDAASVAGVVVVGRCGEVVVFDASTRRWKLAPGRRAAWVGPIGAGAAALFLGAPALLAYRP